MGQPGGIKILHGGEAQSTVYDFGDHDIRFKVGAVRCVHPIHNSEEFLRACPSGAPPIKILADTEDTKQQHDGRNMSSSEYSVTSKLPRGLGNNCAVNLRPSAELERADMVTFVRRITDRKVFICPALQSIVIGAASTSENNNNSDINNKSSSSRYPAVKVIGVLAAGYHYEGEGASLDHCKQFVDLSLEIDTSALKSFMRDASSAIDSVSEGEYTDNEEGDNFDNEENVRADVGAHFRADSGAEFNIEQHIDAIIAEVLRVSDAIRDKWNVHN